MELKAHFSNIQQVIIDHLKAAENEILVAVAWFTDREIFEVLRGKVREGVMVSVVLIADEINKGPWALNFSLLTNLGGHVAFLPAASRNESIMHHKFCVIDAATVITGSYNWSNKARSNDENITVVSDDAGFAEMYLEVFRELVARVGHGDPCAVDRDAVRRRLELIRNLVALGERSDIEPHLNKLRPVAETLRFSQVISAFDDGRYQAALEEIDAYLLQVTALVSTEFVDAPRLRFHLKTLELRLESLADEKADLERRLVTFNRRHDEALGDVIQRVLKARAELAGLVVAERRNGTDNESRKEAEAEAAAAADSYKEYARAHEKLQRAAPLPELDEASEQELKSLYRKACSLCHPDKFPAEMKEAAHRAFVELQDAYKSNNLVRVRELYKVLAAGGMPGIRSTTLSKVEALATAIAEMEFAISRQVAEFKALYESEAVKLMSSAGEEGEGWVRFFDRQKTALETELVVIGARMTEMQWGG